MSAQHTPAPWEACERGDYADDGIVILGDDRRIAVVNQEVDARLIAAAPELLRALEAFRNHLSGTPNPSAVLVLLAEADIVIAKARGES